MPKAKKNKKTILIIEDDPLFASIYKEKFEEAGYAVEVVMDGETGRAAALRKGWDLILLDLMLPRVNGFDVLATIKSAADKAVAGVPVFVVTNLGTETDMHRAKTLGAEAYFVKPNTLMSSVMARVRAALGD